MPTNVTSNRTITIYRRSIGAVLKWQYKGSSSQPFCFSNGYNPIGDSCSVENEIKVVAEIDIGYPSGTCHELICKKQ